MKVVITGANSAVGQAILRCGPKRADARDTFVAAVRSVRAAEQLRSLLGSAGGVVQISYEDPAQPRCGVSGGFRGHPPRGNSHREAGLDL